jgi:hypothetical protein
MQWIAVDDATPIANNAKFPMLRAFYLAINHILNRQWRTSMRQPRHAPLKYEELNRTVLRNPRAHRSGDGDQLLITPESTPYLDTAVACIYLSSLLWLYY